VRVLSGEAQAPIVPFEMMTTQGGLTTDISWLVVFGLSQIIPFLPHVTTMVVLVFASQPLRPPAADGRISRRGQGG